MKVKIDREGCISCGMCVSICPEVFRIANDGLSEVYSEVNNSNSSLVQEAADNCPVDVIHTEN